MKHHPSYLELIGPAGAGKTTLINSLIQSNKNIVKAPKPSYRDGKNIRFLTLNILPLLPIVFRKKPNSRWFNHREIYWMLFLNGWHHLLDQQTPSNWVLSLLDHGPIYMLASLLEFGPEFTQSNHFRNWWGRKLKEWSIFLDIVVWLDAPNPVLAKRINSRDSWHEVKEAPDQVINSFLDRSRKSFEQLISLSRAQNKSFEVIQVRTDRETPEQIKDRVMDAFQIYPQDL